MATAPVPAWVPGLIFTDHLRRPPARRLDLVPGSVTVSKTIVMQKSRAQIHSTLPMVDVWTYDGHYPGPMIIVRRGQVIQVTWVNAVHGGYPVRVIQAAEPGTGDPKPQNEPGDSGGSEVMGIPDGARTVVHLHGGQTQADSDGWPDNTLAQGHATVSRYEVGQQAAFLWYHDHAMGITRYNIYAGLAGLWVVRDDEEHDLIALGKLPDPDHEMFLAIQDKNLATTDNSATGPPSHQLLHKIDGGTGEFFGPFTLVNGTIWPMHPVQPRTYRVRVLNASNARTYGLELRYVGDDNEPTSTPVPAGAIRQIGTDGGLLPKASPVDAAPDGLGPLVVLAPAERVDLLIDFGVLAESANGAGCRVAWFNTAKAPYDGTYLSPDDQSADREDLRLKYPQVIRFDVAPGQPAPAFPTPVPLSQQYHRLSRADVGMNPFRLVALLEITDPAGGTMLLLRELIEQPPAAATACHAMEGGPLPVEVDATGKPRVYNLTMPGEASPRTYLVAAQNFYDTTNFMVKFGDAEEWRFLNLTGDTHPIHVHLVQFQLLDRTPYLVPSEFDDCGFPNHDEPIVPDSASVAPPEGSPDTGWKDTIRVNPGEMVAIVAKFEPFMGRYMYHCHVVEHEDRDMMRPFVVAGMMMDMSHPQATMPAQASGRDGQPRK